MMDKWLTKMLVERLSIPLPGKEFWMDQELMLGLVELGKITNVSMFAQIASKRIGNE